MHTRLSLFLGAYVVAAAFFSNANAQATEWPTITNDRYTASSETQAPGKQIMLTGIVTVKDFGFNDLAYCGFNNENKTLVKAAIGGAGIRFPQQRSKQNAKWYIKEVRSEGKIIWEFKPQGYALTQGRTYTMRAAIKIPANTQTSSYMMRFYCESKTFYPNGTVKDFNYPFGKIYKTIQIV